MDLLKTPNPAKTNANKHDQFFIIYLELIIHIALTTFIHNFNLMGWGIIGTLGQNWENYKYDCYVTKVFSFQFWM
jgi:hypothetical protein